jgi:hypothetical protein
VRSTVIGECGDRSAPVVSPEHPLLRIEALPIIHPAQRPRNHGSASRLDVQRAASTKPGLIMEDELVIGKPGRAERLEGRRVIALGLAPELPALLVEIGAIGKVEHAIL